MKRVRKVFERLQRKGRCGLVAYVTCGDPDLETTVAIVRALQESGADAIELGVPFSDPIADGPVIQEASFRALSRGTTVADVLAAARAIRGFSEIPLIAFSYLNPIMRYGERRFADDGADAGIDAVLVTDLPPESAEPLRKALRKRNVGMVFLLAPTSSDDRIERVAAASDGFVYYVSTTGVTGTRRDLDPELLARLETVRKRVSLPLAVGFGVSRREHYETLSPHCDAVVVWSAIVRAIADGAPEGAPGRAGEVVRSILGDRR
jgi:tryptophan synthase alpha chain